MAERTWAGPAAPSICTPVGGPTRRYWQTGRSACSNTARRSRMPFFLHFSFNDPHPSYFVPPPYDSMVDPDQVVLPVMGPRRRQGPLGKQQALREVRDR